jgi:hypothetical protein
MTDGTDIINGGSYGTVITDPDEYVDGETLSQWTEQWYRWAVPTPGGTMDAFNDPTGTVAAQLNFGFGPLYFITQQAPQQGTPTPRTFNVHLGQAVLIPIGGAAYSEGPDITPTQPKYGDHYVAEVQSDLKLFDFTSGSYSLDGGPITSLPEITSSVFDAGFARTGSAGADFFGVLPSSTAYPNGTELSTTAQEGFWAVLDHLSPGTHNFTASFNVAGVSGAFSIHDVINVA